jgi:hypothetical protein
LAVVRAKAHPVTLRPEVVEARPDDYSRFIGFVAWLQVTRRRDPIFLPVRSVGQALGFSSGTASNYLRWAIEDRYLEQTAKAQGHIKAAEYRFNLSRFPSIDTAPGCVREELPK